MTKQQQENFEGGILATKAQWDKIKIFRDLMAPKHDPRIVAGLANTENWKEQRSFYHQKELK